MRLPILIASLSLALSGGASAQSQPYRIFFDWGKQDITRDGRGILDQVVSAYQGSHPKSVHIAAHTDRSGSSAYNVAASKRRAKAVMDYLVAQGVPANVIIISAYGEGQPIVPTEDGVREVQNRRVEITFGN